jgi:quinolinate synthase
VDFFPFLSLFPRGQGVMQKEVPIDIEDALISTDLTFSIKFNYIYKLMERKEYTQDTLNRIREWLDKRHAILLAHNYQPPDIQDAADMCGDSLELSKRASETDADVIVFCGVHFMAETAAILSPQKKVILPRSTAGCPMADMITADALRREKEKLPDAVVVSYVNTPADVKAESDICCTSANAVQVVRSIQGDKKILMTPDKNLAQYTIKETGRDISYWEGFCPIHDRLRVSQVKKVRHVHPDAIFLAHPECPPDVLEMADKILSTSGMIDYANRCDDEEFIIGTETGILHALSKGNPGKRFYPADPDMVCPDMKKTSLHDVLKSLETMQPIVAVPQYIQGRARKALDRMVSIPKG